MSLRFTSFLLVLAVVLPDVSPNECTDQGGTCKDWRTNLCTAGYSTSDCDVEDPNIWCCLPCDAACEKRHQSWTSWDMKCTNMNGNCQINTNYCDCDCDLATCSHYQSGICDGPPERQCCVTQVPTIRESTHTKQATQTVSPAGYALIKEFEGLKLTAYQDVAGIWTIGYGNTKYIDGQPVKQGDTITQADAESLFEYYVDKFATDVNNLVCNVNQQQFEALVSFTYNLGKGAFAKSTLLKKIKKNPNDSTIRAEFMKWVRAGGKVIAGLKDRRKKEADYYGAAP